MARAPRVAVATTATAGPAAVTSPVAATAVAAPSAAPAPDTPVRRPYRVLSRLKWGGERLGIGATVAMTDAEAETLVSLGVLSDVPTGT